MPLAEMPSTCRASSSRKNRVGMHCGLAVLISRNVTDQRSDLDLLFDLDGQILLTFPIEERKFSR